MKVPKHGTPVRQGKIPPQPPCDYSQDITDEQLEMLRRVADPDGGRAAHRRLLCEPGW
jgi:hypothetical protein